MGKIDHNKSPVWRQGDGFGDFEAKKQTSEQWWNIYKERPNTNAKELSQKSPARIGTIYQGRKKQL